MAASEFCSILQLGMSQIRKNFQKTTTKQMGMKGMRSMEKNRLYEINNWDRIDLRGKSGILHLFCEKSKFLNCFEKVSYFSIILRKFGCSLFVLIKVSQFF